MARREARWHPAGVRWRCLLGLAGLLGCEASEDQLASARGFLEVTPDRIELGAVRLGAILEVDLELAVIGATEVRVLDVRWDEGHVVARDALGDLTGRRLERGETRALRLELSPQAPGPLQGDVVLVTDGRSELVSIPVRGEAVEVRVDDLQIRPTLVDFGAVLVGERSARTVSIRNLARVSARVRSEPLPGLRFSQPEGALDIEPGAERALRLEWTPGEEGDLDAALPLVLEPADAALGAVFGTSAPGGRLLCPDVVAFGEVRRGSELAREIVCAVQGGGVRTASVALFGSRAYFASTPRIAGGAVSFTVTMRPYVLAGPALARGLITTSHGETAEIRLEGRALEPREEDVDIAVRLTWDAAFADLDLHFVRSEASPFTEGDDCYFAAKNPRWGDLGQRQDDPFLDRDAVRGQGPETISLQTATEEVFDVYVHYFDFDPVVGEVATEATVRVAVRGQPTERSRSLGRCGQMWHVGRVERTAQGLAWLDVDATLDFEAFAEPKCR